MIYINIFSIHPINVLNAGPFQGHHPTRQERHKEGQECEERGPR